MLAVFSDVFQMQKATMQLWTEDLERITGLTNEQRALLVTLVDGLQNEIYQHLLDMKASKHTPNQRSEIEIDDPFAEQPEEDLIG